MTQALSTKAIAVLAGATCDGTQVKLPPQKLDRSLYEEVNEVLVRLGGKWKGGKVAAHLFPFDVTEQLQAIVDTELMPPKNPLAFFPTPDFLVREMLSYVGDLDGKRVLEPSAGTGAIADAVRGTYPNVELGLIEIDPFRASILRKKGYVNVVEADFLEVQHDRQYDCILMNPPFSVEGDKTAYLTHIQKAYELLAPGGRLVAIAAPGFTFRSDKKHTAFRELVGSNYSEVDAGSFKESGTNIKTVLLWLDKPAIAQQEAA